MNSYPEAAKKCQLSMSVLVNFKVDSKGNVDDVKVDRISTEPESSGKSVEVSDKDKEAAVRSLFEEAEKVVKSSPKWKPAISEGKPVDAVYKFSINFMEGDEWRRQMLHYVEGNIDYVDSYLKENIPSVKALRPEVSFLVWLDCRGLGLDQKALADLFINGAHLALNDGTMNLQ
jgi:TonB family C-terminal domain